MSIRGGDLIATLTGGLFEQTGSISAPIASSSSTQLDSRLLPKVTAILTKLGKNLIFYVPDTSGDYDPNTGEYIEGDITQYIKKAIPPYEVENKYIDGDIVQVGDLITGIAGQNIEFTPTKGMKIGIDNQLWEIQKVSPIYSGEQIALYMLQLRR